MHSTPAVIVGALIALCVGLGPVLAQDSGDVAPLETPVATEQSSAAQRRVVLQTPIIAFDRSAILSQSNIGVSLTEETTRLEAEVVAQNERVNSELEAEERALLDLKATVSAEEFRVLADAFDAKVVEARALAEERALSVQTASEEGLVRFEQALNGVLTSIARDVGAVAVFERQQIYLLSGTIDISNEAISRLNALSDTLEQEAEQASPATSSDANAASPSGPQNP